MIARSTRTRLLALFTSAALAAAGVLAVAPAAQAVAEVYTFSPQNGTQIFTVPRGVTQMVVQLAGAAGGELRPSGRGAVVEHSVAVTPGQRFFVVVGGGSGDSTDIRTIAPGQPGSLESRVVVAGGGGSEGTNGYARDVNTGEVYRVGGGPGGDAPGIPGASPAYAGESAAIFPGSEGGAGGAGALDAGGSGGRAGAAPQDFALSNSGPAGAAGEFGAGGRSTGGGGRGGGGWYGGGSGGTGGRYSTSTQSGIAGSGGGGGGSSYPASASIVGGNDRMSGSAQITVERDTTAPVITVPAPITVTATSPAGAAVPYEVSAVDNVDGSVPVTCERYPGEVIGIGTTVFGCTAQDAAGNVGSASITVTVLPVPPTITGTPPEGVVGQRYSFTYTLTGDPRVTIAGSIPGLEFVTSATEATLLGTPTRPGSFTITLTAETASDATTTKTDTIRVVPADASPTVTTQLQSRTVVAGAQASFTTAASGYPAPDVQWERSNDGVTWSRISGATTTVYSLTATTADDGTRFRAVFTNRAGTITSDPATLTVQTPPTITAAPPVGVVGQAYTTNLVLTGSPTPTVAVTSGSLPPGLSLSAAGLLSGTPTPAGSFPVTFTATSAAGSATAPATIVISSATATKADLAVTVSAPGGKAGTKTTWTVTVRNTGPATATSVYTTLLAPKGVTITGVSSKGTRYGQSAVWTTSPIASGATVTYTVAVTLARSGTGIVVAGTGSAKTPDPRLLNNIAAATVRITP